MGAFNSAQYNLTRYNIGPFDHFYLFAVLTENVSVSSAPAAKYTPASVLAESVSETVETVGTFFAAAEGAEVIGQTTSVYMYFYVSASGSETLTRTCGIAAANYAVGNSAETVTGSTDISEHIVLSALLPESVSKTLSISEQVFLSESLSENIDSAAELEAFDYCYCSLDVMIPPSSVLVIDAANYEVYLDGENVLYAHSGDWLDGLNRTTESIKITGTGSSNLSASILYTEKYL